MCYIDFSDYIDIYDYLETEKMYCDMTDEEKDVYGQCQEMASILDDVAQSEEAYEALVRDFMNKGMDMSGNDKKRLARKMVEDYKRENGYYDTYESDWSLFLKDRASYM